jgi:hypothetical protein
VEEEKKIYINQTDDMEENNEKNKKILTILIILILFSGVYYYYGYFKKVPEIEKTQSSQSVVKSDKLKNATIPAINLSKKELSSANLQDENKDLKKIIQSPKADLKVIASQKEKKLVFSSGRIILPTKKQNIISFAVTSGGKSDPFYDKSAQFMPIGKVNGNLKNSNYLSPSGLPSITGVPSLGGTLLSSMDYADKIELKGFIGNKAILGYEGDIQSLKVNNFFHGAKIVSVNPYSLSIKLKKGNKLYTKKIKDLADTSNEQFNSSLPKLNM